MSGLSRQDLSVIEGEARVTCRRLAEVLGFNRVNDLHRLIRANADELADLGEVFCFSAKNPSSKGGRPMQSFYLNEHQAVAISMWANTTTARAARRLIVEVFVAYRRGDLHQLAALKQQADPFKTSAERCRHVADQLQAMAGMDNLAAQVAKLPIWTNGRRPRWWHDLAVREFLTVTHRQMTTLEAAAVGRQKFGQRCPGKSSINEYWRRLDGAHGLPVRSYPRGPKLILIGDADA